MGHAGAIISGGKGGAGRLLRVGKPTLFETPFAPDQMRLFRLAETLGEDGWLKVRQGWTTVDEVMRVTQEF